MGSIGAGIVAPELLMPAEPRGVDPERRLHGKPPLEVAREFEAILVAQMITAMRRTVPSAGLLQGSSANRMLEGAFDQELARSMTKRGDLGIARQLVGEIERHAAGTATATTTTALAPATRAKPSLGAPPIAVGVGTIASVRPVDGEITSRFGVRRDPITGAAEFHAGIDLAAPKGTAVRAVAPGEVIFAGRRGDAGNVVEVRHPGAVVTTYAHVDRALVRAGQKVAAGDVLATVGATGRTTGPHLHFAVHRGGQAIDPAQVLGRYRAALALPARLAARRGGV